MANESDGCADFDRPVTHRILICLEGVVLRLSVRACLLCARRTGTEKAPWIFWGPTSGPPTQWTHMGECLRGTCSHRADLQYMVSHDGMRD